MGLAKVSETKGAESTPVAVIIVAWNSGGMLDRCLRALAAQTLAPRRVIVIDNAGSDDAVSRAQGEYPAWDFIRLEENIGFAAANNLGILRVDDCPLVALLNPDAFPDPQWLERLTDAARRHTRAASFSSLLLDADNPEVIDGAGDRYHISGLAWRRHHRKRIGSVTLREVPVFSACAAAALYRRECLIAAGLFDERFFCYVEDVDLGFRLQSGGGDCIFVPDARVLHVGSGSSATVPGFALFYGVRNLSWAFWKNVPAALMPLCLPLHCVMMTCMTLWYILRGQGSVILRAHRAALAGLPAVLRARHGTQRARRVSVLHLLRRMRFGPGFLSRS